MPSPSLAKLAARPRTVSLPPATPSIKNRDSDAAPPSLAKLAARSRAVTLPPATPSIDTLASFADDDGLIRFIRDTSHKCSN